MAFCGKVVGFRKDSTNKVNMPYYCGKPAITMKDDDGILFSMCDKHWEEYINDQPTKKEIEQLKQSMILQAIEENMTDEEADVFLKSAGF